MSHLRSVGPCLQVRWVSAKGVPVEPPHVLLWSIFTLLRHEDVVPTEKMSQRDGLLENFRGTLCPFPSKCTILRSVDCRCCASAPSRPQDMSRLSVDSTRRLKAPFARRRRCHQGRKSLPALSCAESSRSSVTAPAHCSHFRRAACRRPRCQRSPAASGFETETRRKKDLHRLLALVEQQVFEGAQLTGIASYF